MKIVLIGIQGSGKSTQGNLLSKQLGIPYLSTGHIFRDLAKEKTSLGRYIKETINAGILVPDSKVNDIVSEYLSRSEYKKGYILDGFPRTLNQVKKFKNGIDKVIYLKITNKEAVWRLIHRHDDSRKDETIPALRKRIDMFYKFTEPVIKYYDKKKKLSLIDGTQPIDKVNEDILKSLGKQLIKNKIKNWERKNKIILLITGLPGAGKTAASSYFKNKGFPVVELGKIINEYITNNKLPHTEEVHKKVREELRQKYGKEAMIVLNKNKIKDAFKTSDVVAVDGLRSWEEYGCIKNMFPKIKTVILALYADKKIRYKRIASRHFRNKLGGESRDTNELIGINMAPTIGFADYFIDGNGSLEDLKDKLEVIYRVIYYS